MNNRRLPLIVIGVIGIIVLMSISSSLFYTIQSNERAIIFYPFTTGLNKDNVIDQGTHMKAPWNTVYVYKVNEMSSDENMDILDKNGLSIHVDITVRYFPIPEKILVPLGAIMVIFLLDGTTYTESLFKIVVSLT